MNSERINYLLEELNKQPYVLDGTGFIPKAPPSYDGREPFHDTWMAQEGKSYDVRLALAYAAQRGAVLPRIEEKQLIIGDVLPCAIITYHTGFLDWDFKLDKRLQEKHPQGKQILEYWETYLASREPLGEANRNSRAYEATYGVDLLFCHSTQDYGLAIETGISGLREKTKKYAEINKESADWYEAVQISLNGACAYIRAHEKAYRAAAEELLNTDPVRAKECLAIADNCEYLAAGNAPGNFWQACQLFWFLFYLNGHDSPGRMDQYLYPPLKRDLDRGVLTLEEAQEITDCLYCKLAENLAYGATIGGQTREGKDATNQMSWLCLSSIRRLRLLSPRTTLRVHKNTPEDLFMEAVASSAEGATFPTFVNDEIVIPSMVRRGTSYEDALDYTFCGCGQVIPSCRSYGGYEDVTLNVTKALLLTLHGGCDELTGEKSGIDTGNLSDFASYEDLESAVLKQLTYMMAFVVKESCLGKQWAAKYMCDPLRSVMTYCCLEKGKDFRRGGAEYHDGMLNALGLPTLADSLVAIRRVVYEQRLCTLPELTQVCDRNWEGREDLLKACLQAPKFGNDDDDADQTMVRLVHYMSDDLFGRRTAFGGPWGIDIVGWSGAVNYGKVTGATPNGRKKGDPLADCAGPSQGMDKKGITAVLLSMGKLPTYKIHGPLTLSAKFAPKAVQGENLSRLAELIKVYFEMGGTQLQPTVVSGEELRKAQQEPEKWRHLIVRVGGFSARFVDLNADFQADMIKRTENL